MRALFLACIQQHDHEDKQHHNGAGVHDHLRSSQELRPKRPVQHRQRHHHDDQRERAVDRVPLKQQVQSSCHREQPKDNEQCELHQNSAESFSITCRSFKRARAIFEPLKTCAYLLIVNAVAAYPRNARTRLLAIMFAIASGSRNFQPKLINWS